MLSTSHDVGTRKHGSDKMETMTLGHVSLSGASTKGMILTCVRGKKKEEWGFSFIHSHCFYLSAVLGLV